MPTNVTPEYKKAEEAYREAKSLDEKVERLKDMISLLPKHKGTDHLYADLKRRLAKLKRELESSGGRKGGSKGLDFYREGAAQIILIGPPNSGKSSIMRAVTHARPEVGDYPFTTSRMIPGMVPYQDIQMQLIDTPPITGEYMHSQLLGLVRSTDAVLIVVDLANDSLLDDLEMLFSVFRNRHTSFARNRAPENRDKILSRIIANKIDTTDAHERLALLREMIGDRLEITPLSCLDEEDIGRMPQMLFRWLEIVRVYTKIPGKKPDMDHPYTVFRGGTVEDICALVHRDFTENLKFARLWRMSEAPITVSRHEPVEDGDILELHL
jgi:ribosome-interacting GTPase 1